jgi:hypothetical protein
MPYFRPAEIDGPTSDSDRETALQSRIRAIESDLERVNAFPSGKDSLTYRSLQGMLSYWRSVQNGALASDIECLAIPDEGVVALGMARVIENDLNQIEALMMEEASPSKVTPGRDHGVIDNSLFISKESTSALRDFARQLYNSTSDC